MNRNPGSIHMVNSWCLYHLFLKVSSWMNSLNNSPFFWETTTFPFSSYSVVAETKDIVLRIRSCDFSPNDVENSEHSIRKIHKTRFFWSHIQYSKLSFLDLYLGEVSLCLRSWFYSVLHYEILQKMVVYKRAEEIHWIIPVKIHVEIKMQEKKFGTHRRIITFGRIISNILIFIIECAFVAWNLKHKCFDITFHFSYQCNDDYRERVEHSGNSEWINFWFLNWCENFQEVIFGENEKDVS